MKAKNLIEIIEVSLEKNKDSSKDIDEENTLYYDRFSRNIFDVDENGIRVYNRKAKNLKTNFLITLPKETLLSIAIDKELKYLLCLIVSHKKKNVDPNEINRKLIVVNTTKTKIIDKISDDFIYLLGMFFIGKILDLKNLDINNNANNTNDFCTVFCDKVVFYGIEKKGNNEEYIKKLSTITTSKNLLIINFLFDYKHKILCLVYSDLSISFIILNSRKNYKQLVTKKLPCVNTLKAKTSFMGMFRKVNEDHKLRVKNNYDNLDIYTESQFYLETIYNELYLIYLCYESNEIFLYKLENLNNLDNFRKIDYKEHSRFSALQVIDNLILIHNFLTKIIIVIDIKSKIPIIRTFCINFIYQNNLHFNGEILEERKVLSTNKLISVNGGKLYLIKFNEKVYDELEEKDLQERRIKKKNLGEKRKSKMMIEKKPKMNYYDILKNILNRKGTNNLILNILYKIILNNLEKPFHIINFFKEIINLENTAKEKIEVISDKKLVKKEISESNLPFEVPKPFNLVKAKKNYIQQMDILRYLFAKFGNEFNSNKNNDEKSDENNKNINDDLIIRVIFYMIQFSNEINKRKIELKPGFYSIILKYIKMIQQKEKLIPFFEYETVPDNEEIGKYLVEISFDNNYSKYKEIFEEYGFKILYRTKSHLLIIDFLLKKGDISRAVNYLYEKYSKLDEHKIEEILLNNKEVIEKNKDLFMQYIN